MKDKLGNIGESVSSIDLVIITLNGMFDGYQMFVIGLVERDIALTFNELIGILMQEEQRRKNIMLQNLNLELMVKGKRSSNGKPWEGSNEGSPPHINSSFGNPYYSSLNKVCDLQRVMLE